MKITSHFKKSAKEFYSLDLDDASHADIGVDVTIINSITLEESYMNIEATLYSKPGFFMSIEQGQLSTADSIDLSISGDHFLITFFVSGNCLLFDYDTERRDDYCAGMVRRSRSTNSRIAFSCQSDSTVQRLILVLSPEYAFELLKNEEWVISDDYFSNTEHFVSNRTLEHYFIDATIKAILNDLAGDTNYGSHQGTFLDLKMKELFFMLHMQHELFSTDRSMSQELYAKLVNAKAFLLANFAEPPTIRQLSRIVVLNEFKLKKYFKELFGTTIHSLIIQLRMEEAEKLLREDCSVGEMALRTGYRSVSHFIVTFKSYYGLTPMQAIKAQQLSLYKAV